MSRHKTLIGMGWVCAALAFFPGYETSSTTRDGATVETTRWRIGLSPLVEVEAKHAVKSADSGAHTDSMERNVQFHLLSLSTALAVAGLSLLAWGVLTRGREAPASDPGTPLQD